MKNKHFYLILLFLVTACTSNKTDVPVDVEKVALKALFTMLSPEETGIDFNNRILDNDELILTHEYIYNGSGIAVGDINNDGLPDLFFTAVNLDNRLYLNKGNLKFEDITKNAGILPRQALSTGTTMIDINQDGYLDIYVCRAGKFSPERGQIYSTLITGILLLLKRPKNMVWLI